MRDPAGSGRRADNEPGTTERRLYLARKQFERAHGAERHRVCLFHALTIVYKACVLSGPRGLLSGSHSTEFVTPFTGLPSALRHQRFPWHRASPATLGHNGEINTVWGNRARMAARDATLPVECKPVLTQGGTDSTSLDEAVELISQNGRTLAEAMRMLLPPADPSEHTSSFLRYHYDCAQP